jgi:hypothetical protein
MSLFCVNSALDPIWVGRRWFTMNLNFIDRKFDGSNLVRVMKSSKKYRQSGCLYTGGVKLHKIFNFNYLYKSQILRTVVGFKGAPYYIKPTTIRRICSNSCKSLLLKSPQQSVKFAVAFVK